uniref:Uncharacterized protein n=1 Tax=Rubinisphaera brasiliensis (strain ATCC 49424 / DSM 5305 / JCM 21570 / IAM 15109 / NBRC 103401 / IFAM 1448) TaxID=756272 RepID=F0SNR9_RUBBR|nr:hypothetical protein Plabr_1343 [Rubinisphaera brasiliensis DSM 5305]
MWVNAANFQSSSLRTGRKKTTEDTERASQTTGWPGLSSPGDAVARGLSCDCSCSLQSQAEGDRPTDFEPDGKPQEKPTMAAPSALESTDHPCAATRVASMKAPWASSGRHIFLVRSQEIRTQTQGGPVFYASVRLSRSPGGCFERDRLPYLASSERKSPRPMPPSSSSISGLLSFVRVS